MLLFLTRKNFRFLNSSRQHGMDLSWSLNLQRSWVNLNSTQHSLTVIRPQPAETTQQREELEIAVAPTALIGLQALAVHARNNNSSGTLLLGTSAFLKFPQFAFTYSFTSQWCHVNVLAWNPRLPATSLVWNTLFVKPKYCMMHSVITLLPGIPFYVSANQKQHWDSKMRFSPLTLLLCNTVQMHSWRKVTDSSL